MFKSIINGRKKLIQILIVALTVVAAVTAVSCFKEDAGGIINIDTKEAESLINEGIVVIDVRTPGEYSTGHIPEAKSIPLNALPDRVDELDKTKPYIVVCLSGNRSMQAAKYLISQGFEKIYNLSGGMMAWKGKETR